MKTLSILLFGLFAASQTVAQVSPADWSTATLTGVETRANRVEYTIQNTRCRLTGELSISESMPKLKVGEQVKYAQIGSKFFLVDDEGRTYTARFTRQELMPLPPAWVDFELGTWKLNLEKSVFKPGPAPLSATRTYETTSAGIHFTQRGVSADGRSSIVEFTARYDGKDYPLTGSPSVNSIAITLVGPFTADAVEKKNGKPVLSVRRLISQDGKSMTVTSKGTTADGRTIDNVMVFDRQ
jgi:hypothetical protein